MIDLASRQLSNPESVAVLDIGDLVEMQLEREEVVDCGGVKDHAFGFLADVERRRPYPDEKAVAVAKLDAVAYEITHIETRRILAGDQFQADQTVPIEAPATLKKMRISGEGSAYLKLGLAEYTTNRWGGSEQGVKAIAAGQPPGRTRRAVTKTWEKSRGAGAAYSSRKVSARSYQEYCIMQPHSQSPSPLSSDSRHFNEPSSMKESAMRSNADDDNQRLLNTAQAAFYLGLTASTLNKWRMTGEGPAFIRLSPRRIMYERPVLDSYKSGRRFFSTSEYPRPGKLRRRQPSDHSNHN